MRGLNQLGTVETIYEEECEFSSTSSSFSSPSFSSNPASLNSRVKAWSLKIGRETDVLVRVQGICFRLHKDRVVSQSSYLKRRLTETSDLTLSPPLNITAETFAAVAEFCYNGKVQITPANVAVILTAAELLGMTAGDGLSHVAERRFREIVGTNEEYASTVLRSFLPLLHEAETTASLVSRCIEALVCVHGVTRLDDVKEIRPKDFQTVTESLSRRFENHDVLYKMVDFYLKENEFEKVTEEERSGMCNLIDCTKLSSGRLVECVQNPRMPLRLVVRAVMVEHVNTRHSIAIASACQGQRGQRRQQQGRRRSMTLGELLYRDAVQWETAQMKRVMDSTSTRIGRLEQEVGCIKRVLLRECNNERSVLESERSKSCHFVRRVENGPVLNKGERCSTLSSRNIRFHAINDDTNVNPKMNATFRQRFIIGLKNAFRVPNSASA